jgi:hypothetical protein
MPGLHMKTLISACLVALLFFSNPLKDAVADERSSHVAAPGINRNMIVRPVDVYGEFNKISRLIDAMGFYMGVTPPVSLGVKVSDVTPYDIYFQALGVFNTANRLSFEILRKRSKSSPQTPENIQPADIMQLAVNTMKVLEWVVDDFGLSIKYAESPMEAVTPRDVFREIVKARRYLNLLLERRFSPSDVYQIVNRAIGYASLLLKHYQSPERIPKAPKLEAGKTPLDVFFRLNDCLKILSEIYQAAGMEVLEFDVSGVDKTSITPADVYDLASLILARLHSYKKAAGIKNLPPKTYYPGHKYPSHVYRQAGILLNQLDLILSKTKKN